MSFSPQSQSDSRVQEQAALTKKNAAAAMPHVGEYPDALHYELGVTRYFGIGDIGKQGLIGGWAAPEDGHIWNDGPDAQLLIVMNAPADACILTLEGSPFVSPRQPQQDVTLFANGHRIAFWRFREGIPQKMISRIEPEIFITRGQIGILKISWFLPNSVRPSEIGEGEDGRELGFVFRSIVLTQTI